MKIRNSGPSIMDSQNNGAKTNATLDMISSIMRILDKVYNCP